MSTLIFDTLLCGHNCGANRGEQILRMRSNNICFFSFCFPRFDGSVLALEIVSLFVRISAPSKSLDKDCLVDASSVARSRALRLPTEFSDENVDASRVDVDVYRLIS